MLNLILNGLKSIILISILYVLFLSVFYTDSNWSIEVLNTVYCEGTDNSLSNKEDLKEIVEDVVKKVTNINHNLNVEVSPNISSALKLATGAFSSYVSLSGAAKAASFIPNPYCKAACYVGSFGLISGIQKVIYDSLSNDIVFKTTPNVELNTVSQNEFTYSNKVIDLLKDLPTSSNKVTESLEVPSTNQSQDSVDPNIVANSISETGDSGFFVNSVIETTNAFDGILSGMIILAITGLYTLISFGLGILTRELKLEEKDWVKSRPFLLKMFTLNKYSSRVVLLYLYLLIFLSLLFILITLIYIKSQLPIKLQ